MRVSVVRWGENAWPFVSIALLSIVAWGGVLLTPNSRYWDDWVAGNDPLGLYRDIGLPWMGPIYQSLFAIGPWTLKVLGLVSIIAIGCILYLVAGREFGLSRFERCVVAVLAVVLPFNSARIGPAVLETYTYCLLLFVSAWYLMVCRPPARAGIIRYAAAAGLLFLSYTTASLIPFTVVPLAHLALLVGRGADRPWRAILRAAPRYWYLIAAPIAFWIVRALFFQPRGLYIGYNSFVSLAWPLSIPARGVLFFCAAGVAAVVALAVSEFRGPLNRRPIRVVALIGLILLTTVLAALIFFSSDGQDRAREFIAALLAVAALLLIPTAVRVARSDDESGVSRAVARMVSVGILLVAVGALPYLLVGKPPSFSGWDTRNQLLLPFGTVVIVLAGLRAMARRTILLRVIAATAVAASVLIALFASLGLVADWNKQSQITEALRHNNLARQSQTVVFEDLAPSLNFDSRSYSTFEVVGWLRTAFGDQSRYALNPAEVAVFVATDPEEVERYGSRYGYATYHYTTRGALLSISSVPGATWWGLLLDQRSITITVTPVQDVSSLEPGR